MDRIGVSGVASATNYQKLEETGHLRRTRSFNRLHQLLTKGRAYKVGKRQIVQSSDDRYRPLVNLVKSGYIKRYEIGNDGSLSIQAIYGPDDIFPLTLAFKSLFDLDIYEGPEIIYYETIGDAELTSLDVQTLTEAVKNDPLLYRDLLFEAGMRANSSTQRLENFSLKSSFRRTAHQLIFFAKKFGDSALGTTRIKVMLTHQDIADVLNLTRETVSINLHKLQERKIIKPGRFIEIINLDELEHIAYS